MSDELTPEKLDQIEARANAATEGPWIAKSRREGPTGVAVLGAKREYYYGDECVLDRPVIADLWIQPTAPGTPDFIAHARTDAPALVAEVRRLTAEVERWRACYRDALDEANEASRVAEVHHRRLCNANIRLGESQAERDELRAAIERVEALADSMDGRDDVYAVQETDDWPHNEVCVEAVPVHELRAALHPEET